MPIATASRRSRKASGHPPGSRDQPTEAGPPARGFSDLVRPPKPGTSRQPRLVLIGLALILICAGLGVVLSRRSGHPGRYLETRAALPVGSRLEPDDLSLAEMTSPSGIQAIPASEEGDVIGDRLSETVVAGTLLVPGDLSSERPPTRGEALIGTSLQPDQLPSGLEVGDSVLLVSSAGGTSSTTPADGSAVPGKSTGDLGYGVVFAVGAGGSDADTSGSGAFITVAVPAAIASEAAATSAAGELSLAEVPDVDPSTSAVR